MTYNEFKSINDRNKILRPDLIGRIDSLDIKNRRCVFIFNNSIKNIDIDSLVKNIIEGRGSISNPSKLSNFNFNKKVSDNNMFYRRNKVITLCHGSDHEIRKPFYGGGEISNDYGSGFYCVSEKNKELAKEWSCSIYGNSSDGIVNTYEFSTEDMSILNLDKFDIIYWIVLTAYFRGINTNSNYYRQLLQRYLIDLSNYDCVYGWRCDDTFSNIIKRFFDETFSANTLREAIRLGHLQQQFVLISKRSFDNIKFIKSESVPYKKYSIKFQKRKDDADKGVRMCQRRNKNGKYVYDYLEGDV